MLSPTRRRSFYGEGDANAGSSRASHSKAKRGFGATVEGGEGAVRPGAQHHPPSQHRALGLASPLVRQRSRHGGPAEGRTYTDVATIKLRWSKKTTNAASASKNSGPCQSTF